MISPGDTEPRDDGGGGHAAVKLASTSTVKGYVACCEDPIVSSDMVTDPHSCIFDRA